MRETTIALKGIEVQDFLPKTSDTTIKVTYVCGNTSSSFTKVIRLEKPELLTETIIKEIKQKGKIECNETDDAIKRMQVIHFHNEDKIEEKLFTFLAKLCEKNRYLRHITNHAEYMKIFDEIKIKKIDF